MAVTGISESFKSRSLSSGLSSRTCRRVFQVTFDDADDPVKRDLLAQYASYGGVTIPRRYVSTHPSDPWLYVQNVTTNPTDSPFVFEVVVEYGWPETSQNSEDEPFANPMEQEPEISWSFRTSQVPIDRDIYGNPITNSSGESYSPAATKDVSDLVLHYSRNMAGFDALYAMEYKDSVNADYFLGFAPGLAKVDVFSGDRMRAANLIYWKVTIEIIFRTEPVTDSSGNVVEYVGWKLRMLDEGYRTVNSETGEYTNITDTESNAVSQPVKLNGSGGLYTGESFNAVFNTWEINKKRMFSNLGIA